jgi:hypothetical protein
MGVLLYELLTGVTPFDRQHFSSMAAIFSTENESRAVGLGMLIAACQGEGAVDYAGTSEVVARR